MGNDLILSHLKFYGPLYVVTIGLIVFCFFIITGCSSMDREMMEWEGDYDCVIMQDGRAFCK